VETVTVSDLKPGDFVITIPTQNGVRGIRVNSGIRTVSDDWDTWTCSSGPRRPRISQLSRELRFNDAKLGSVNVPASFAVQARRPQ